MLSEKHREYLQHTTSLKVRRIADYNHISSCKGCTTEGLPPERQDSSGSLTLPSASSPSSTDEGHHHDPRDSIKTYWDPAASMKQAQHYHTLARSKGTVQQFQASTRYTEKYLTGSLGPTKPQNSAEEKG